MTRPFVSVVTPTYDRHLFLPNLFRMFQLQTYPQDRMELVILDDSPSPFDMTPYREMSNVRYIYHPERLRLPRKRNMLNELARGDIIVAADEDDYMFPDRVAHSVQKLQSSSALIAGCTEIYVYDCPTRNAYRFGPYGPYHTTNGAMAYKREYLKDNRYDENTDHETGEEKFFCKDFTNPLVQLNPWSALICMNHRGGGEPGAGDRPNTFDKARLYAPERLVRIDLRKIIRDKQVRDFFLGLQ